MRPRLRPAVPILLALSLTVLSAGSARSLAAGQSASAPGTRGSEVTVLERSLPVTSPLELEVRVRRIDVSIRPGARDAVDLRAVVREADEAAARQAARGLDCKVWNGGSRIRVECGEPPWAADPDADSGADAAPSGELVLRVPEATRATIVTGGGRVEIPRLSGRIDLDTGGGDILLGRVEGTLSIRSGGGNVWVERVSEGPVEVEAGDGGVGIESSRAPLEVRTGTGEIMVGLAQSVRTNLVSDSGDITVVVSRDVGFQFDADGRFVVLGQSMPLKAFLTKRHGEGEIGEGGASLTVETPEGCVRIGTARDLGPDGGIAETCRLLAEEERKKEERERQEERDGGG